MNEMIHFIHRILRLNSIPIRFFFWVIVLVLLTSCLYLLSYITFDKNKRITETKTALDYGLVNQRIILENWAANRAEEIRLLASFPASKELQLDTMVKRYQYYHQYYEQINSIVFVDADGFVRIDTASSELMIHDSNVSLKDRDYFIAAEQGKEYMYDVIISKASGNPTIIFSAPVFSDDQDFQGVIFSAVHLSNVNDMLRQSLQGESGEITLINEEGFIVSHLFENSEKASKLQELATKLDTKNFEKISTERNGFLEYVNHHGDEVFAAFTSLFDGRYFLINEISKREVLQFHYQMVAILLSITFVIIVTSIVLIIPVSRQLLRPFDYLVKAIKRMKLGKYYTQLEPDKFKSSPTELQQMMQVFNEMATSIQENQKKLLELSSTDGLTGIANRRAIEDYLDKEWRHAQREQSPLSLALIDIDFFKKYNDTFGHLEGDTCLINIANAIKNAVRRPRDFVGRYGGEEFIAILPETNREAATVVAERIRKQIEELRILRTKRDVGKYVTVSIGIATVIPFDKIEKEDLIQLADQALYEAKTSGRNKLVTYEE